MDNWYDYQNNSISDFIKAYRESLEAQRDSNIKQLNQTRKNYFSSIMGGANRRGMMYSNFPQRDKLIYDTNTYNPTLSKIQTTYQTGLDTLRNNAVGLWNKIKSYEEAISDLNSSGSSSGTTTDNSDAIKALVDAWNKKKNSSTDDEDDDEEEKKSGNSGGGGKGYAGGGINSGTGGAGW